MLYTLISDNEHRPMVWDAEHIASLVGDLGVAIEKRIDINHEPRSFKGVFDEPLKVSFPGIAKEYKDKPLPDICDVMGRLFLNMKAYDALQPLIENDGEFVPLTFEGGKAYLFVPLRTAEEVDGVDTKLSRKNEWGDLESLAFHEERVKEWMTFRTMFNACVTIQCQQAVKDTIENAGLKGLYITPELGCISAYERGDVVKTN